MLCLCPVVRDPTQIRNNFSVEIQIMPAGVCVHNEAVKVGQTQWMDAKKDQKRFPFSEDIFQLYFTTHLILSF